MTKAFGIIALALTGVLVSSPVFAHGPAGAKGDMDSARPSVNDRDNGGRDDSSALPGAVHRPDVDRDEAPAASPPTEPQVTPPAIPDRDRDRDRDLGVPRPDRDRGLGDDSHAPSDSDMGRSDTR